MAGFEFMYRLCGAGPTIKNLLLTGGETHKGDIVTLTAGTVSAAGSTATNLLGVALSEQTGATGVRIPVILDADAVYAVVDANVRAMGTVLDIAGATGEQTVTPCVGAAPGKNFVVVEDSTAAEKTKVRFNVGKHHYSKAQ